MVVVAKVEVPKTVKVLVTNKVSIVLVPVTVRSLMVVVAKVEVPKTVKVLVTNKVSIVLVPVTVRSLMVVVAKVVEVVKLLVLPSSTKVLVPTCENCRVPVACKLRLFPLRISMVVAVVVPVP